MKEKLTKTFIVFCLMSLFISCDVPGCTNTNPVFEKYAPESSEYKTELARQLRTDNSGLSYWLDSYQEKDSISYLHVSIQGKNLCAKGVLTIREWDTNALEIRESKGKGYTGAELKSPNIEISEKDGKTELLYKGMDAILD